MMNEYMDGRIDGWKGERRNGRMNGWMEWKGERRAELTPRPISFGMYVNLVIWHMLVHVAPCRLLFVIWHMLVHVGPCGLLFIIWHIWVHVDS